MKILKTVVILSLFLSVVVFAGCGGDQNANIRPPANADLENTNSVKTSIEELGVLVTIPFEAEDGVWNETADHKQIIAVLRFSREDANRIVADAAARRTPERVQLSAESWFPPELIAQSEMSGDDTLNGLAYPADSFYQEPYTSGRIARIYGTDYFVLELSAK